MNDATPLGPPCDAPCDPGAHARHLAATIEAAADAIERTRRLPARLLDALHEARLFRMLLPRSVGGGEVEPGVYVRAIEELARADGSVGWCVSIANSTGLIAAYMDLAVAREIWGDKRATVAWGPPNESRAVAVPGGYRAAAAGISPVAAGTPAGSARTALSSSPTAACGSTATAARPCAAGCSRQAPRP